MADVAETTTYADAATAISQGKRHLLVQDYTAAVTAFAEGLEMLSAKLGDCDDELGEPYLLYGRALLGLAREEVGVLGGGVPGTEEDEDIEEEDDEEEGDDDKGSDAEKKEESMEVSESGEKKESETSKEANAADSAKEELKEEANKPSANEEPAGSSNKTDDKKIEEKKTSPEKQAKKQENDVDSVPGSSKEPHTNGSTSATDKNCNGTAKSEEADEDDDVNNDDDEEDPGRGIDLQVAWEVLELAKIVFVKRGETGLKHLAETHRLLGEVAMESDNPNGAITDFESSLKLLQKMEPCEPRAIAELHYQLGLAYSLLNDYDGSIEQFREATTLLEARIKQLEELKEPPPTKIDDPFYSIEGEIKELKELLPAIEEKITDIKDFKQETCRLVIEGIKSQVAGGGCTNGAGTSSDGASSSSHSAVSPKAAKPASDISHLVRKKRKADDNEPEQAPSPCKKPTP